jgi:hypothetical protein
MRCVCDLGKGLCRMRLERAAVWRQHLKSRSVRSGTAGARDLYVLRKKEVDRFACSQLSAIEAVPSQVTLHLLGKAM